MKSSRYYCTHTMVASATARAAFLALASLATCDALSTAAVPSSVWAPARWRISVDIGREKDTWMPKDWGASGGRLVLPIDVEVSSDPAAEPNAERDIMGGSASAIVPVAEPTFVNERGEQTVGVAGGGWKIGTQDAGRGRAATLRFWLDFAPAGDDESPAATRGDVTLPAERLYFAAGVWRREELARGAAALEPLVEETRRTQERLERRLDHERGDRRLDGTNPLDTALAYKEMADLVGARDAALRRQRDLEAELLLPRDASKLPMGPFPGSEEPLALAPGGIMIRKKKSFFAFADEYLILGKWRATPLEDG